MHVWLGAHLRALVEDGRPRVEAALGVGPLDAVRQRHATRRALARRAERRHRIHRILLDLLRLPARRRLGRCARARRIRQRRARRYRDGGLSRRWCRCGRGGGWLGRGGRDGCARVDGSRSLDVGAVRARRTACNAKPFVERVDRCGLSASTACERTLIDRVAARVGLAAWAAQRGLLGLSDAPSWNRGWPGWNCRVSQTARGRVGRRTVQFASSLAAGSKAWPQPSRAQVLDRSATSERVARCAHIDIADGQLACSVLCAARAVCSPHSGTLKSKVHEARGAPTRQSATSVFEALDRR